MHVLPIHHAMLGAWTERHEAQLALPDAEARAPCARGADAMTWDLRIGDCLDPITGMASLADKSVDHVISDPPFEAEAHTLGRRVKRGRDNHGDKTGALAGIEASADGHNARAESLAFAPITEVQRIDAARQFGRLARRWVLVFCQIEAAMKWREALEAAGLVYKRTCIWAKPDGMPQLTGDRPGMGYETIVACHAPGRSTWNGGGRTSVFTCNKNESAAERSGHQTQKPLALMDMLIRLFTDRDELVLDPFAGSGSTAVSAIKAGRRFVGWEMNETYHATAMRRLVGVKEQTLLDWGTGT